MLINLEGLSLSDVNQIKVNQTLLVSGLCWSLLFFRITVDLKTANDLAFHFNPRFNEGGRRVIVRNSCIGTKWGREERELQNFPFVPGQPFEVRSLFYISRKAVLDSRASST